MSMSGGAGASDSGSRREAAGTPSRPPLKRHLAFVSTRPPFAPTDEYHSFAAVDSRKVPDHVTEAVIVRSPVSFSF
jgi:transcription factor E2F3